MTLFRPAVPLLAMLAGALFVAPFATAQTVNAPGSIAGTVFIDTSEVTLANAEISLPNLKLAVRSDAKGNFRIAGVPPGQHVIMVPMLGYQPFTATMTFAAAQNVEADLMLTPVVTKLEKVNVRAAVDPRYATRLAEFEERRRFGFGRFLTADVFEKAEGQNLSQLLVTRLPGIRTLGRSSQQVLVSIRGGSCPVQVILNGVSIFNGAQPVFDINSLYTGNVIGLEYYTVATTPAQFNATGARGGGSQCGTVVIWTK